MSKKRFALLLSAVLLFTAAFSMLSTAALAEPADKAIYLNGKDGDDANDGLTVYTPVKTFGKAKELAESDLNITKIKVLGTVNIEGDIMLDGTNAIVQRDESFAGYLFEVSGGKDATLKNITIDGNSEGADAANVKVQSSLINVQDSQSTLNIENGTMLKNNKLINTDPGYLKGGAISVSSEATLNMFGGTIENNMANQGGGVYIQKANFNMYGGEIKNNSAPSGKTGKAGNVTYDYYDVAGSGGGVHLCYGANMNLTGGLIKENNAAEVGGGISLSGLQTSDNDRLNMTGGTIDGNSAGATGGGIFIQAGVGGTDENKKFGKAEISAGYITYNKTTGKGKTYDYFGGGGIYVNGGNYRTGAGKINNGELYLTNVIISGNESSLSGGGYAACPSTVTKIYVKDGAAIYGNNSTYHDKNAKDVYIDGSNAYGSEHSGNPEYEIDERMLGGVPYNWKYASNGSLVSPDKLKGSLPDHDPAPGQYKYTLSLNAGENGDNSAKPLGKVFIIGNSSVTRGGGIGSNGSVFMGRNDKPKKDLMIKKTWEKGMMPKEVKVQLRGNMEIDGKNEEWKIQEIVLNEDNGFIYTAENLPATIGDELIDGVIIDGKKIENIVDVVELGVDPKNVEISEFFHALTLKVDRPGTLDVAGMVEHAYANYFRETGNKQYYDEETGNLVGLKDFSVRINLHNKITGKTESKYINYYADFYDYGSFTMGKWEETVNFEYVPVKSDEDNIKIEYYQNENSEDGKFEQYLLEYDIYLDADDEGKTLIKLPDIKPRADILRCKAEPAENGNKRFVIKLHNTEKIDINVGKEWNDNGDQDGKRPDSITVKLLANGIDTDKALLLSAADNWTAKFEDLPKYENGTEIVYTIMEEEVGNGYTAGIGGGAAEGFVLTNTYTPETVDKSGSKTWNDNDNQDGKRPESIIVRLMNGNAEVAAKTITEEDGWKWTFKDLPKYENGTEIEYTFKEDAVKEYTSKVNGFTITNTYITPSPTPIVTSTPTAKPIVTSTPTAKPIVTPKPDYPTISVQLKANKKVENGKLEANEFTFVLKDSHGKELARATNDADGAVIFPDRTFSRVVENYTYTIEEAIGEEKNLNYDKTVYKVKVTTKDANGRLEARVDIEKDGVPHDGEMVFTNTYSYPKTGDSAPKIILSLLLAAFVAGIASYAVRKNKRRDA